MLEEPFVSFTALDRCDRCGAQAIAQADKDSFAALMFCNHHTSKYEDALLNGGWTLRWDESKKKQLVSTPGGSAW